MKEDVGWYGKADFTDELFDSVVREISKVFQRLSTLIYLALKLRYGLSLSYVV